MSDYKKTLNLPSTTFPMKASLTQNEPKVLEGWYANDAYGAMVSANVVKPRRSQNITVSSSARACMV